MMRIDSHDYGSWHMPWNGVCKLETKNADVVIQSKSRSLRMRGVTGVTTSPRSRPKKLHRGRIADTSLRVQRITRQEPCYEMVGRDECPDLRGNKENLPFLNFLVLYGPSKDWMMTLHIGEGESLFSLLIQMLISSRNTLTNRSRNNILPDIWAYLCPVKPIQN